MSQHTFFYSGHPYSVSKAWKAKSACTSFVEHAIKEIIKPSFFLDDLIGLFDPKVITKLLKHNISLVALQKRVYAIRKLQENQWLGVEVLAKNKLGDPVILDEKGNIVETLQRTKAHQTRINRRRRFDTKLIAAFTS